MRLRLAPLALASLLAAATASAQTFSNTGTIGIPDAGNASPYPATIVTSGVTGALQSVTLRDVFHTFQQDLDIALVSPTNQAILLFSEQGGSADLSGATLTFADGAAAYTGNSFISGAFSLQPIGGTGGSFSGALPSGLTFVSSLSQLTGNANGAWKLYVYDDAAGDQGAIRDGWSMSFAQTTTPEPATLALMGTGLLALAGVARRRRSA